MAKHQRRKVRSRSSGRAARLVGVLLGVALGCGVVLAATVPLAYADARHELSPASLYVPPASVNGFAWPSKGPAAVAIPLLGVSDETTSQPELPIASLTKLMTAFVVLRHLPLSTGATGPCVTVTDSDVEEYQSEQLSDQSSVKVAAGVSLCELDLLNGLFVHSANNYAHLLVRLVGLDEEHFIAEMNATAKSLGMLRTTYTDVAGIEPTSESTAHDQMVLVQRLMVVPVVREIVAQTSVILPVAGVVRTYTPLLGTKGVVGIKSGRTDEAGGCDALALRATVAGRDILVLAVVLNQQGPDTLKAAGDAAYALARSGVDQIVGRTWNVGEQFGKVGWIGHSSALVMTGVRGSPGGSTWAIWWRKSPALTVSVLRTTSPMRVARPVGSVVFPPCVNCQHGADIVLGVLHEVSRPSWWNGLR